MFGWNSEVVWIQPVNEEGVKTFRFYQSYLKQVQLFEYESATLFSDAAHIPRYQCSQVIILTDMVLYLRNMT